MKVLLIGPMPYPITGVSVANEAVVKALEQRGVDYRIIDTHIEKNVSSRQGGKFSLRKALAFLGVYRDLFAVKKADVVYTTPGQTFFGILKYAPFYLLCLLSDRPYVIHLHGNYLGKEYERLSGLKKRIFRFLVSRASAGIVLSESLRGNFSRLLKEEKVHVIRNFVSQELAAADVSSRRYDMLRILYMSNLMREKGALDLLDALRLLKKRDIPFYAEFAGSIEPGIRDRVEKKLKKLGDRAKYLGLVEKQDKQEAFLRSNVFVLPTWYIMEGQPISVIEAMATGNLVVVTAHAGIPDIAGKEEAFFVHKNDPEDLARALIQISENLPELQQMGLHNREVALSSFREDVFGEKILSLLSGLTGKRPG